MIYQLHRWLLNNRTYANVLVFESNKDVVLEPSNIYPKNVNVIYYEYNYGVIGFDDLNGNQWRIQ